MRLLLDEMLSPRIAVALREKGVDVVSISETPALRSWPDQDVMNLAARDDRVLVTDNIKDFAPINRSWAAEGRTHPGLLYVSTKAIPQNAARVGRVTALLLDRVTGNRWPGPGQADFL